MNNKNQHWITCSYLEGWIDPNTPPGQDGYVWMFSKNGDTSKRKAPKNIFSETDFYTQRTSDGSRDLTLEGELSTIESNFITTRRHKLDSIQNLNSEDILSIIKFASTMMYRTKIRREKEKQ
jgi:hypothetical protein